MMEKGISRLYMTTLPKNFGIRSSGPALRHGCCCCLLNLEGASHVVLDVAAAVTYASQIDIVLSSYIQKGTTCQDRIHDTLKPAKRKGKWERALGAGLKEGFTLTTNSQSHTIKRINHHFFTV